jgi:peptidoglycan/LPS O-acetylase OafA/YrhL
VRDRYFDLLRAVAIVRVVIYHATGWAFLTILFPAMGMMFALSGSLMAASLDRHGTRALARRARRVLPPLWLVAAVFVPAMLFTGLALDWRMLFWIAPLGDPPTNGWGSMMLGLLWYVRQYLWFVLLSPLLLPLFRRLPLPTIALPVAALLAVEFGPAAFQALRDFAIYLGCWLLGFAHHDGMLARIRRWRLVTAAMVIGAGGAAWFLTHPGPRGFDLNDIAIGHALWSASFALLLLGISPPRLAWLDRWRAPSRVVTMLNHRAMTVYLWHQAVIVGLGTLVGVIGWNLAGAGGLALWLLAVAVVLVVAIAAFGWVEDLAARRPLAFVPRLRHARGGTGLA